MIDRPPKQVGVRELRDRLTSVMTDVQETTRYIVLRNSHPMAVIISNEEALYWERVERALAALHGLEVYPELARGTSELALIVRGQRRFSRRELERLARERRRVLEAAHTVGVSDARLRMAEILDGVLRGQKWMLLTYRHFAVVMIPPSEYERLQRLRRVVAWFRTAGLDLPESDEAAIARWVREYRSAPPANPTDSGFRDERGQVALYAVLLFPVLMLVLALVLTVGTLEAARSRLRAQLDVASLTATQALDFAALAAGEPPSLIAAEAEGLAREYLARNLAAVGVPSAGSVAASAQVAVVSSGEVDPIRGVVVVAPTVSIRASVPTELPMLTLIGLQTTVSVTVTGSAAART